MTKNMSKITLELIANSINEVKTSVDNLEIRLKEHVSNEIGGLAYMVYKVEERLIDRMDGFELRMDSFDNKLDNLDIRVSGLEDRFSELDHKVDLLDDKIHIMHTDMGNQFDGVYEHFHKLEISKIDRIHSMV